MSGDDQWMCEHCANAPNRKYGAFLAHQACQDADCACARNLHAGPRTLVHEMHDEQIRSVREED